MFGSVVIDVVIAMALVFIVFSLITSGLRELVAWLARTRSKELWRSIRDLLEDPISNGLRPLREAIAGQHPDARVSNAGAVDEVERRLRADRDHASTTAEWAAAVDQHLSGLAVHLDGLDDPAGLVANSVTRLKRAYSERETVWITQVWRFFRRGDDVRPRVPAVPTVGSVTAPAESVREGVRTLTDAVYDHPVVRQIDRTARGRRSRLTRLEAGDFSAAALDLIQTSGIDRTIEVAWMNALALIAVDGPGEDLESRIETRLGELKRRIAAGGATGAGVASTFDSLAVELAEHATAALSATDWRSRLSGLEAELVDLAENVEPLELVEAGLHALEHVGPVRETVARAASAARAAGTAVDRQVEDIAAALGGWYDERMAALTVWYRKRSRIVGFLLALLVVLGFNVDAIDLPRELWQNESVRSAVVAIAESSQLALDECRNEEDDAARECVTERVDQLIGTGLPLGWSDPDDCEGGCGWIGEELWHAAGIDAGARGGVVKLIGWLLAAAALTMGASFWFDVLRRAMGIRAVMRGEESSRS